MQGARGFTIDRFNRVDVNHNPFFEDDGDGRGKRAIVSTKKGEELSWLHAKDNTYVLAR